MIENKVIAELLRDIQERCDDYEDYQMISSNMATVAKLLELDDYHAKKGIQKLKDDLMES